MLDLYSFVFCILAAHYQGMSESSGNSFGAKNRNEMCA